MSKFQRRQNDPSVPKTTGELNDLIGRNSNTNDHEKKQQENIFNFTPNGPVNEVIDRAQQKLRNQEEPEARGVLIGGKRHSTRRNKRTFRRKSLKTRQLFTRRKKRHDTL